MKNKIFQSRDLCLRALDTNLTCAKSVRGKEEKSMKKSIITVVGKDTVGLLQEYVHIWQITTSIFWIFPRQLCRDILI